MDKKGGEIDFGTSGPWGRYYAETQKPPKLKNVKHEPTIKVSGITLHNIAPDDRIDETMGPKLEENLKKLGILPITEKLPETPASPLAGKTDFLDLVPEISTQGKRLEKAMDKTNRILNQRGLAGEIARARLLTPDASHDASMMRKQRRAANGLPEKAPPWRDLQRDFLALTPDQINFLREIRFHPDRVTNPHSETVELMLLRLKQYGKL